MPIHQLRLDTVVSTLENSTLLGRPLFHGDVSAYEDRAGLVLQHVRETVEDVLKDLPLLEHHRRHAAGNPEVSEVTVELQPPVRSDVWSAPILLRFHVVYWEHGTAAAIAFVPALGIRIVARRMADLHEQVPKQIEFALMRREANTSLRKLVWLQRCESMRIDSGPLSIEVKTLKQSILGDEDDATESVLRKVGTNLTRVKLPEAFEVDDVVLSLGDWLVGKTPRSVLLVGPSGAGKTAVVYETVRQRKSLQLEHTPFWATSGARLIAGMCGFGMWQERCQELVKEASKTKAVVHLGNLVELMQVGQYEGNDQGVGDFLRTHIARGDLLAVAECTPEQLTMLERQSPNMIEAFVQLKIKEPDARDGRRILRRFIQSRSKKGCDRLSEDGLDALDRLHRRYATYSAYPGRPLRFINNLLEDAHPEKQLNAVDVTEAFSRESGLPRILLEDDAPLDLDQTRQWFGERVIGQPRAIGVVVDTLATVKAGLVRPERPIASMLFVGPTGVGKTETAKALAEFLYQDPRRMTRIDMSEYADPMAVDRLFGGNSGDGGLLTSKVREQPFGVILFDEFEKAHPRFFDLLLQVLGEGRLTDASGRLADFRNSVIIMTSNLGTHTFGRPSLGFGETGPASAGAEEHFVDEVRKFVRPEMFNRIDRIVSFMPLSRETLRKIARRELDLLKQRDGIRFRNLRLEFSSALADEAVRLGYDPRYGARPIKRAIDRHLLAPLAEAVNEHSFDTPLEVEVEVADQGIRTRAHCRQMPASQAATAGPDSNATLEEIANKTIDLRREVMVIDSCYVLMNMRNRIHRLREMLKRQEKRQLNGGPHPDPFLQAELARFERMVGQADDLLEAVNLLEENTLIACYMAEDYNVGEIQRELDTWRAELQKICMNLYESAHDAHSFLNLVVYGEFAPAVVALMRAYHEMAKRGAYQTNLFEIKSCASPAPMGKDRFGLGDRNSQKPSLVKQANDTSLMAQRVTDPEEYLQTAPEGFIGLALTLRGQLVHPRLYPEDGLHVVLDGSKKFRCLIHTSSRQMKEYRPPSRIDRHAAVGGQPVRRTYNRTNGMVEDKQTRTSRRWTAGELGAVVESLVDEHFQNRIDEWFRS